MKTSFSVLVIVSALLSQIIVCQELNTPAAIIKIMADSKIQYKINVTEEFMEDTTKYPLNGYDLYQETKDGRVILKEYALSEKAGQAFKTAEEHFSNKEFEKARKFYKKVLNENKTYSVAMTYIGQTYELEKKDDDAIKWFKKAIKANYIDYMAHWFLASAYHRTGESRNALNEVAIALTLNRNNPRLETLAITIALKNKLFYNSWFFTPQYTLSSDSDTVRIFAKKEWLAYALCKAVWRYEPGYKEKKGIKNESLFTSVEENECLANIILGHMNSEGEKLSEAESINFLLEAFKRKKLSEFMIYEVWLRKYPQIIYSLPKETIDNIADYVSRFHFEKKQKH